VAAADDLHDAKILYASSLSRQSRDEIAASPITLIPALKYGAFPLLIVKTAPSFAAATVRCLTRCWQVGRFGLDQNDNMNYKGSPVFVEQFITTRANAICHLSSKERRAGRFGQARALLRVSGLELWQLGQVMRTDTPAEIPPRYREDSIPGLRVLSPGFLKDFVNLVSGRKDAHFSRDLRQSLIDAGFHGPEGWRSFTELGRKLVAEQIAHEQSDKPSLMSVADFTAPTAFAPDEVPEDDEDEPFVPYEEALSGLKVTTVLARVQEEAPDLLPFRMEIVKEEGDLSILFRGAELLRLKLPDTDESGISQIKIRHLMPDLLLVRILADIDERARDRLSVDRAFDPGFTP
jgi:hypothetical protein